MLWTSTTAAAVLFVAIAVPNGFGLGAYLVAATFAGLFNIASWILLTRLDRRWTR